MTNQFFNAAKPVVPISSVDAEQPSCERRPEKSRRAWIAGAAVGVFGGLIVLIGAIFLNAFDYLSGENHHFIWLFVPVLPLLALGAHCLDKIEAAEKTRRIERCIRNGMTDEDGEKYEYIN